MAWIFLIGAILFEVAATLSLRKTIDGGKKWLIVVIGGYLGAFVLLALALGAGMALGVAYGIWAAAGVALTAILAKLIFNENFTWIMAAGVALIIGGVLLIELGATH
ncbi:SMR family transporter [Microbacterium maritypicum]|uniref:DMT family transporter n=1 Tax=Microbacterium TaxID=33882 RepID=UPI003ECDAF1A